MMGAQQGPRSTSTLKRVRDVIRHRLVVQTMLDALSKIGFEFSLYYLYRDHPYRENYRPPVPELDAFETIFFGPEEFEQIGNSIGDRDSEKHLLGMHQAGRRCFGLKSGGEVVCYIWSESRAIAYLGHEIRLAPDEAFVFGTYTMRRWRGRNSMTLTRHEFSKELGAMGKTKLRSVISYFNTPAIRLKAKLRPYRYDLYFHVCLFGRWRRQWLVKEGEGGATVGENRL